MHACIYARTASIYTNIYSMEEGQDGQATSGAGLSARGNKGRVGEDMVAGPDG